MSAIESDRTVSGAVVQSQSQGQGPVGPLERLVRLESGPLQALASIEIFERYFRSEAGMQRLFRHVAVHDGGSTMETLSVAFANPGEFDALWLLLLLQCEGTPQELQCVRDLHSAFALAKKIPTGLRLNHPSWGYFPLPNSALDACREASMEAQHMLMVMMESYCCRQPGTGRVHLQSSRILYIQQTLRLQNSEPSLRILALRAVAFLLGVSVDTDNGYRVTIDYAEVPAPVSAPATVSAPLLPSLTQSSASASVSASASSADLAHGTAALGEPASNAYTRLGLAESFLDLIFGSFEASLHRFHDGRIAMRQLHKDLTAKQESHRDALHEYGILFNAITGEDDEERLPVALSHYLKDNEPLRLAYAHKNKCNEALTQLKQRYGKEQQRIMLLVPCVRFSVAVLVHILSVVLAPVLAGETERGAGGAVGTGTKHAGAGARTGAGVDVRVRIIQRLTDVPWNTLLREFYEVERRIYGAVYTRILACVACVLSPTLQATLSTDDFVVEPDLDLPYVDDAPQNRRRVTYPCIVRKALSDLVNPTLTWTASGAGAGAGGIFPPPEPWQVKQLLHRPARLCPLDTRVSASLVFWAMHHNARIQREVLSWRASILTNTTAAAATTATAATAASGSAAVPARVSAFASAPAAAISGASEGHDHNRNHNPLMWRQLIVRSDVDQEGEGEGAAAFPTDDGSVPHVDREYKEYHEQLADTAIYDFLLQENERALGQERVLNEAAKNKMKLCSDRAVLAFYGNSLSHNFFEVLMQSSAFQLEGRHSEPLRAVHPLAIVALLTSSMSNPVEDVSVSLFSDHKRFIRPLFKMAMKAGELYTRHEDAYLQSLAMHVLGDSLLGPLPVQRHPSCGALFSELATEAPPQLRSSCRVLLEEYAPQLSDIVETCCDIMYRGEMSDMCPMGVTSHIRLTAAVRLLTAVSVIVSPAYILPALRASCTRQFASNCWHVATTSIYERFNIRQDEREEKRADPEDPAQFARFAARKEKNAKCYVSMFLFAIEGALPSLAEHLIREAGWQLTAAKRHSLLQNISLGGVSEAYRCAMLTLCNVLCAPPNCGGGTPGGEMLELFLEETNFLSAIMLKCLSRTSHVRDMPHMSQWKRLPRYFENNTELLNMQTSQQIFRLASRLICNGRAGHGGHIPHMSTTNEFILYFTLSLSHSNSNSANTAAAAGVAGSAGVDAGAGCSSLEHATNLLCYSSERLQRVSEACCSDFLLLLRPSCLQQAKSSRPDAVLPSLPAAQQTQNTNNTASRRQLQRQRDEAPKISLSGPAVGGGTSGSNGSDAHSDSHSHSHSLLQGSYDDDALEEYATEQSNAWEEYVQAFYFVTLRDSALLSVEYLQQVCDKRLEMQANVHRTCARLFQRLPRLVALSVYLPRVTSDTGPGAVESYPQGKTPQSSPSVSPPVWIVSPCATHIIPHTRYGHFHLGLSRNVCDLVAVLCYRHEGCSKLVLENGVMASLCSAMNDCASDAKALLSVGEGVRTVWSECITLTIEALVSRDVDAWAYCQNVSGIEGLLTLIALGNDTVRKLCVSTMLDHTAEENTGRDYIDKLVGKDCISSFQILLQARDEDLVLVTLRLIKVVVIASRQFRVEAFSSKHAKFFRAITNMLTWPQIEIQCVVCGIFDYFCSEDAAALRLVLLKCDAVQHLVHIASGRKKSHAKANAAIGGSSGSSDSSSSNADDLAALAAKTVANLTLSDESDFLVGSAPLRSTLENSGILPVLAKRGGSSNQHK